MPCFVEYFVSRLTTFSSVMAVVRAIVVPKNARIVLTRPLVMAGLQGLIFATKLPSYNTRTGSLGILWTISDSRMNKIIGKCLGDYETHRQTILTAMSTPYLT